MEPLPAGKRSTKWLQQNALAVLMFFAWIVAQVVSGDRWMLAREAKIDLLESELAGMKRELALSQSTYVRQDVFNAVLQRIDERLTSIDGKISRR